MCVYLALLEFLPGLCFTIHTGVHVCLLSYLRLIWPKPGKKGPFVWDEDGRRGRRGLQGDFGILWGHYNCSTVHQLRKMCDTPNKVVVVAVVVMTARPS